MAFIHLYYMENKEIKLHVQLTEKDYLKFQSNHFGYFKSSRWWFYGVFVAIFVLADFMSNGFSGIGLTSIISILVFASIIAVSVFSMRAKIKSAFKSDITHQHPMDIIINNEGLNINAYRANINPLWEEIYRYSITKNTIYIYTSENKSIIIPKYVFENETDLNTVIELLKSKVDLSRHKKQSSKTIYITWIFSAVIFISILSYTLYDSVGESGMQSKAWDFENKGDYKSASEIYSQLILDNPNIDTYYGYRAKCEIELSEYKSAIKDCEKAISIQPSGWIYYTYAYALYYDERYKDACHAINKSIEMGYTKDNEGLCDLPEN